MDLRFAGSMGLWWVLLCGLGAAPAADADDGKNVSAEICSAIATPAEMSELVGIEREFFLRFSPIEANRGGTCRWGVHDEWAGPRCQSVTPEDRARGDCVERVAEISFNCSPETTLKTSAAEHVRHSALLGGEELDIGDGGYLERQNVKFAQSGCVVTVQRLRSMDLDEGFTGGELDQALVRLAEEASAALGGR